MADRSDGPGDHPLAVFLIFLRLGLTSFGGPMAHLGYFREAFVTRRRWLAERDFADLTALCQLLPGPVSSQLGMAIGAQRAGLAGAIAAWLGFTAPSALLMVAAAIGALSLTPGADAWLHGLKLAAVPIVAQAVWSMARTLCPDRSRATIAVIAAATLVLIPSNMTQVAVLAVGAHVGFLLLKPPAEPHGAKVDAIGGIGRPTALLALSLFATLFVGLPILAETSDQSIIALADRFFRVGSLVFGGGHVVLPLLQSEVVAPGWVSNDLFLAGYGAAQAVPGPMFSFAAYLGAVQQTGGRPIVGATVALFAIFLPAFLLLIGVLPFWDQLRRWGHMQSALMGVNAAVVGLLLAALYSPVITSAVITPLDAAVALAGFLLLVVWRQPSWLVVGLIFMVSGALAAWTPLA